MTLQAVWDMGRSELMALLEEGHPIADGILDDTEYRGVSLGLPPLVEKLTWTKFRKAFHRDPVTGLLRGWNVRLVQNGVGAEDIPLRRGGAPHTFGHFEVRDLTGYAMPHGRGAAAKVGPGRMLDYGKGGNGLDPVRFLRDPLVALEVGDGRRLLGWSYLDILGRSVATPSFFTLELAGPLSHVAHP